MDATGDRPGFEERFEALAALSYRVGYRLVGDRSEAEDLAQEALARAYASWRKIAAYDEAWVGRVTVNLAIGRWRKHRRLVVTADAARAGDRHDHGWDRDGGGVGSPGAPPGSSSTSGPASGSGSGPVRRRGPRSAPRAPWGREPSSGPTDALERIDLMRALAALPRRQREVVALRYLVDLPEAAVARALGCAPGTVKQHAHRGLAALRASLGHLDPNAAATPDAEEQGHVRASR